MITRVIVCIIIIILDNIITPVACFIPASAAAAAKYYKYIDFTFSFVVSCRAP